MTYYRLAVQDHRTTRWFWKTTAITSLQAVLQLLRVYRIHPQDGIRVFTASSKEALREMLSRQNNNLASGSVTVAQFLQKRNLARGRKAQNTAERSVPVQTVQRETDFAKRAKELWDKHVAAQAARQAMSVAPSSLLPEYPTTASVASNLSMILPEKKRLEIELGPGGDHDTPYLFTLSISQKEHLAWIRLRKQVQAGELLP